MSNLDTLPLHEPIFTTSQARAVAGVNASVFKNWTNGPNPVFPMGESDIRSPGTGHDHKLTYATVLHLVIMSRLVALGIPPRTASMAGLKFAHMGDVVAYYIGGPVPPYRHPCEHYNEADGDAYIVLSPKDNGETSFEVMPVNSTDGINAITEWGQRSVFAAVNVTKLDEDTRRKLGVSTELPRMAQPR